LDPIDEVTARRRRAASSLIDCAKLRMKKWRYPGVLTTLVLVVGCSSTVEYSPSPASSSNGSVYTVRQGESLYSIAWRYGLDYKQVASWNGIGPPYTIYPGQHLRLNPPAGIARASSSTPRATPTPQPAPTAGIPAPPPPPPRATPLPAPTETARATPITPQPTTSPPSAPVASSSTSPAVSQGWQWPAQGPVIRSFSPDGNGKKGIDIAGELGQPVQAASGGKVVYSGGGLVGYGQLIIIKHNDDFLSAYAHNSKLLVKEGEQVRAGQTIAELGSTGAARPMLHFEIREHGQPVDPLRYLPRR
jgi:lipoprotein NlpD